MPDSIIVENCSPTLAGIKTGNIFTIDRSLVSDIKEELRELNQCFTGKGLRAIPLKVTEKNILIYLYRPDKLKADLSSEEAKDILLKKGYSCKSIESDIVHLIHHIHADGSFPHEIGLFLGYPPVDVKGFMEDTRKGVKCVGYWKVYGDKEKAEKTFSSYKKCTEIYKKCLSGGRCLSQMVVNTICNRTVAS
ncbi:MAG: DUF3793 family protein [Butyrivibrio sp.]|nr:DUF3793 family protein [Butyrivibrio sp.]